MVKSYLKSYLRAICDLGGGFLLFSACLKDPIAMYLVFACLIIAISGPIADSLNKREKDEKAPPVTPSGS